MRWRRVVVGLCVCLWAAGSAAAQLPITGLGVVRSEAKVEVKAKVAAPIRRLAVDEGDVVRVGALVMEQANDPQRAEVDRARSDVRRAESARAEVLLSVEIAGRELERNLKVPDLISARDLELSRDAVRKAEAELRTREDDLARAGAQLAVAEAYLAETVIVAPFDAIVSRIHLRVGATPRVAETPILDLLALEPLTVEVPLPLPYLRQVHAGMPVSVLVEDEHRSIAVTTMGAVRYVYPEVDATTRTFRVKVDVRRQGLQVLPGMLARVSFGVAPRAGR